MAEAPVFARPMAVTGSVAARNRRCPYSVLTRRVGENYSMSLRVRLAWVLTLSRLVGAPLWVGIFFLVPAHSVWPLATALLLEATDAADGLLARGSSSALGAVVDPLADSLFHLLTMLSMGLAGHFSVWWALPLLYRESLVAGLETVASIQRRPCFSARREIWKSRVLASTVLALLALCKWEGPLLAVAALLVGQSTYCLADAAILLCAQGRRLTAA